MPYIKISSCILSIRKGERKLREMKSANLHLSKICFTRGFLSEFDCTVYDIKIKCYDIKIK